MKRTMACAVLFLSVAAAGAASADQIRNDYVSVSASDGRQRGLCNWGKEGKPATIDEAFYRGPTAGGPSCNPGLVAELDFDIPIQAHSSDQVSYTVVFNRYSTYGACVRLNKYSVTGVPLSQSPCVYQYADGQNNFSFATASYSQGERYLVSFHATVPPGGYTGTRSYLQSISVQRTWTDRQ